MPDAINTLPADVRVVEVTVIAMVPEHRLAVARDARHHQYSITRRTEGISLTQLSEGTRLQCVVTNHLPRVLSATVVE